MMITKLQKKLRYSLKRLRSLLSYFLSLRQKKKKKIQEYPVTNDAQIL